MKGVLLKFSNAILFIACALLSQAQFTFIGSISDQNGDPLIGASVQVQGSSLGAVTDFDGNFSLDIPGDEATLVVTYIGYVTEEILVTRNSGPLNMQMRESATALEEVIVTGYGSTTREALTGSVSNLRSKDLNQVPLASVEQTLQGNIAGLQSNMGNGQPGSQVQIRIRGQGSIAASSEPLFVVDGIPMYNPGDGLTNNSETSNTLSNINPNDIASVSVLKDASATAIYGSRAANGVILITTKQGKSGKPKLNLSAQYGWNDWAIKEDNQFRGLTALEYTDLYIEGEMNRGRTLESAISRFNSRYPSLEETSPGSGEFLPAVDITATGTDTWDLGTVRVDTRWLDLISRTGNNQSYDLSLSGGSDAVTYFVSAGYFDQESPIIGVGFDRYSARLNFSGKATDWLTISNNVYFARTSQTGPDDATAWSNPMYNAYLLAPTIPVKNAQGQFYDAHKSFFMGGNNPVGSLSGDDDLEWTQINIIDNFSAEAEIIEGLRIKSAWSINLLNYSEFYFRNSRYGDGRNSNGFAEETNRNVTDWVGTQTINYDRTVSDRHNFNLLLGYEANKHSRRSAQAQGEDFPPNPNLRTLNNAAANFVATSSLTEYAFESVFSRLSYNYDYKYYFTGSVRRDGSSRFGSENRRGTFWSVGLSWRLDQEEFIQGVNFINELKLRASYGTTGNAEIGNFDWLPLIGYGIDYSGSPGGAPTNVGNTALTWEESNTLNIGVDFRIFNRVSGTIEYYNRESENLLLDLPVSRTTGFIDATRNFGAMENKGVELTLDADIINSGDFRMSVGGNITFNNNEITRLNEEFVDGTHDRFLRQEGREYNEYHVFEYAGVNPDDGKALFYTDETRSETTSDIGDAERFYIGKSGTPDFYGGFNTNLSWKGLSLDARFSMTWDNWLYDATAWVVQGDGRFFPRSQTNLVLNRWKQPGDVTDVPQFIWGGNPGSNTQGTSRYIYDGTHIRLRNLTLAYDIPTSIVSKASLGSARVYFRGVNLWTWTRDENLHYDPEAAINGFMESTIPNLKTFSFGIDVGF